MFKGVTQLVYDTRIGPTARALYDTHEILYADPQRYEAFLRRYQTVKKDYLEKLRLRKTNVSMFESSQPAPLEDIKARYLKRIAEKGSDIGFALGEDFNWLSDYLVNAKSDDLYLANTAGGFWVRRSIDGTEAQIFRMIVKLLQAFEPTVLNKP